MVIISAVTTLVLREQCDDEDLEGLRTQVTQLEQDCAERAADLARVQADLERFRIRYRQEVGQLHEQLDALELAIAEAELGQLNRKLEEAGGGLPPPTARPPEPHARFTSDAVRTLFRDVARTIHPDLARDDAARDRRHALMVEANRAYAQGDEVQLRSILRAWESSAEAVPGGEPEATRLRLEHRLAEVGRQRQMVEADLATLQATSLWQLKAMVDQAAVRGKDIVQDMVRRLQRDIMAATNRLDAMRPPG